MKTITTVLPVYDRKEKQAYERAKKSLKDDLYAVVTPRFRLPSMLWNVESDDPGNINRIEILDKDGDNLANSHALQEWPMVSGVAGAAWYNGTFDTFTVVGRNITSAIEVAVGGATGRSQFFALKSGDTFKMTGNLVINSGSIVTFELRDVLNNIILGYNGVAGVYEYEWDVTYDQFYQVVITGGGPATAINFSFTGVSFETPDFINHFWDGKNFALDYINDGFDTFSTEPGNKLNGI